MSRLGCVDPHPIQSQPGHYFQGALILWWFQFSVHRWDRTPEEPSDKERDLAVISTTYLWDPRDVRGAMMEQLQTQSDSWVLLVLFSLLPKACGILVPLVWTTCPLQWKWGVLITRPPGELSNTESWAEITQQASNQDRSASFPKWGVDMEVGLSSAVVMEVWGWLILEYQVHV